MATLTLNKEGETGCCPKFDPTPWDEKEFKWEEKKFVKAKVKTFFHIPVNFGQVAARVIGKIDEVKAEDKPPVCLSDHTSNWNMDIYVAVTKEIQGLENVTLSGNYLSKVYEGSFKETGKWCKDFESYAKKKGYVVKKWYMYYTTCPKCAKIYGKNYVVIMGQI